MSDMNKVAKELKKALTESDNRKPKAYDTEVTVTRVEGNTLWASFPGGETETPVRKTVDAKPGDKIMVRVSGHRAWAVGNETNPPTDNTVANGAWSLADDARRAANVAWEWAEDAHKAADTAWEWADDAHAAADEAHTQADRALVQAERATGYANDALTQLGTVEEVVDTLNWVTEHGSMELTTDTSIDPSHVYFKVDPNGAYVVGDVHYSLVSEPKEEELSTYYILSIDEAVSNYVATHIALTDSGLWVLYDDDANYRLTTDTTIDSSKTYFVASSGGLYVPVITPKVEELGSYYERVETGDPTSGYKIRLGNDGMYVYDDHGHLVSTFGSDIIFDADHAQSIGGENAFITFTPSTTGGDNDTIVIGGNVIMSGSDKTLSETINELNANVEGALTYDHTYSISDGIATFVAHVYRGGQDVTNEFSDGQFTWYYKTEDYVNPRPINRGPNNTNTGKTITVPISWMGYGGEVVGYFTTASQARLLRTNGDDLADVDSRDLVARTSATGNTVRVRDLEYTTALYPTDSILVVTPEDERLTTISNLADVVDKHYVHNQQSASATWSINHNLNKYPSVSVVDSAGTYVVGDVAYIDANNLTVSFQSAFSGKAYMN